MSTPPGSSSRDQVLRLLTLVPLLHKHSVMGIGQAANLLGVSEAQVVRDLKVLFMCGLPGGMPDDLIDVDLDALDNAESGDGQIRVSNVDYLQRPLRLTPREASATLLALRAVQQSAPPESREVIDRALAKLENVVTASDQLVALPNDQERVVAQWRTIAEQAIANGQQLQLTYYVPARDEETERVVDPQQLTVRDGWIYLDAWCYRAEDKRLFRLDRVHDLVLLDSKVEQHSVTTLGADLFLVAVEVPTVRLLLQPAAQWVVEYYPVNSQELRPDGSLEILMKVADPAWLDRLLMRLAGSVTVLSPESLHNRYRAKVEATLAENLRIGVGLSPI
jgi:proteasome accessory factor C